MRIVGLKPVDANGNPSSSFVSVKWEESGNYVDTILTNYKKVPVTDNLGNASNGMASIGHLPSDKFTGTTSFVDPKAKYHKYASNFIPSPYLGDIPNPEYYKTLDRGNGLSDFNGLNNTQILVELGSDYTAANAAWKYSDGSSNLQWYLPALGELCYIMPRFNEINNSITALGGVAFGEYNRFSSSTEFMGDFASILNSETGIVNDYLKKDVGKNVIVFSRL